MPQVPPGIGMTTIAWDGHMVAADSMATTGDYKNPRDVVKLKLEAGILFALCNTSCMFEPLVRWYLASAEPGMMPRAPDADFSFVVFKPGETLYFVQDCPYPSYPGSPNAWGSGGAFAIGAMLNGASAVEAVRIACKANPSGTAPPIYGYKLSFDGWLKIPSRQCA